MEDDELQSTSALNVPIGFHGTNLNESKPQENSIIDKNTAIESNEKLIDDIKARDEAIQVCGRDIRKLREENDILLEKLQKLNAKEDESTLFVEKALNLSKNELSKLSKESLIRIASKLAESLSSSNLEKQSLFDTMKSAKMAVKELVDLKHRYKELEYAHMDLSKEMQKLKCQLKKWDACKKTIQTQEEVIAKMQHVIESSMNGIKPPMLVKDLAVVVESVEDAEEVTCSTSLFESKNDVQSNQDNEKLVENDKKITELENQVRELQKSLAEKTAPPPPVKAEEMKAEPSKNPPDSNALRDAHRKIDQMEAELISKDFRIAALEQQLESSAKEATTEIAELRTRLFEWEMSNSSLDANFNNEMEDLDEVPSFEESMARKKQQADDVVLVDKSKDGESKGGDDHGETAPPVAAGSAVSAAHVLRNNNSTKQLPPESEPPSPAKSLSKTLSQQVAFSPAASPSKLPPLSHSLSAFQSKKLLNRTTKLKRTVEKNSITAAELTVWMEVDHEKDSTQHVYTLKKIEVKDFIKEDTALGRFQPFVEISLGEDGRWTSSTKPIQDAGSTVQWLFDSNGLGDGGMDSNTFMLTNSQLKEGCHMNFTLKRVVGVGDSLLGVGVVEL